MSSTVRGFLGVVAGVAGGAVVMIAIENVSYSLHHMSSSTNINDPEVLKAVMATLPLKVFLLVILGHAAGTFVGAFVASYIAKTVMPGMILGLLFLLAGVLNLATIPHPVWFWVVDLAIYLPTAYLAAKIAAR